MPNEDDLSPVAGNKVTSVRDWPYDQRQSIAYFYIGGLVGFHGTNLTVTVTPWV
jgi:hypothetical protein